MGAVTGPSGARDAAGVSNWTRSAPASVCYRASTPAASQQKEGGAGGSGKEPATAPHVGKHDGAWPPTPARTHRPASHPTDGTPGPHRLAGWLAGRQRTAPDGSVGQNQPEERLGPMFGSRRVSERFVVARHDDLLSTSLPGLSLRTFQDVTAALVEAVDVADVLSGAGLAAPLFAPAAGRTHDGARPPCLFRARDVVGDALVAAVVLSHFRVDAIHKQGFRGPARLPPIVHRSVRILHRGRPRRGRHQSGTERRNGSDVGGRDVALVGSAAGLVAAAGGAGIVCLVVVVAGGCCTGAGRLGRNVVAAAGCIVALVVLNDDGGGGGGRAMLLEEEDDDDDDDEEPFCCAAAGVISVVASETAEPDNDDGDDEEPRAVFPPNQTPTNTAAPTTAISSRPVTTTATTKGRLSLQRHVRLPCSLVGATIAVSAVAAAAAAVAAAAVAVAAAAAVAWFPQYIPARLRTGTRPRPWPKRFPKPNRESCRYLPRPLPRKQVPRAVPVLIYNCPQPSPAG
jgi:hypothetical protein